MADDSGASPVFGLVLGVGCFVNLLIHLWTVVLAYQMKGFWPMLASLVLPGLAEFYWAYMLWNTMPYYSVIAVTVVVVFGILRFIAKVVASGDE
ncbi:MAG TPA: hypothetical protein VN476_06350 [Pyrinomonadaceae bacterium]|nr:hypothetical protein [Pyrinomonadaceae bacterium]